MISIPNMCNALAHIAGGVTGRKVTTLWTVRVTPIIPVLMETFDATGLLCPLPVLKLRKRLTKLSEGREIAMRADDPAAVIDVPHFCAEAGHVLVSVTDVDDGTVYVVRKGAMHKGG